MSGVLATIWTCTHCGQRFAGVPASFDPRHPGFAAWIAFSSALGKHTAERHTKAHDQQVAELQINVSQFANFHSLAAMAQSFATDDPGFGEHWDRMRHSLHKMTRKVQVTDEEIEAMVRDCELQASDIHEVELGETQIDVVVRLLQSLRDQYEERGQYPELDEQQFNPASVSGKKLVTV